MEKGCANRRAQPLTGRFSGRRAALAASSSLHPGPSSRSASLHPDAAGNSCKLFRCAAMNGPEQAREWRRVIAQSLFSYALSYSMTLLRSAVDADEHRCQLHRLLHRACQRSAHGRDVADDMGVLLGTRTLRSCGSRNPMAQVSERAVVRLLDLGPMAAQWALKAAGT